MQNPVPFFLPNHLLGDRPSFSRPSFHSLAGNKPFRLSTATQLFRNACSAVISDPFYFNVNLLNGYKHKYQNQSLTNIALVKDSV